jgi:RNA polymerase sigma factor (sigma-70 family)
MPVVPLPARTFARPRRSRRLLAFGSDSRLVDQLRQGNEAAFEVVYDRYGAALLTFCRHMLGSPEEAEDALQQTFAAAWRNLANGAEREIVLRPWLYTIARNRCLSMLRARREQPAELPELATGGLSEEVEQRAELRELLRDLGGLPEDQREALLLAEAGGLTHVEIASVLGCEVPRVKSLVFRARSGLIARRDARAVPCDEIRQQLANLRGGALRRSELRLHLQECPGCRVYREEVRRQRGMLAAALPVAPGLGLKASVLGAAGAGGGLAGAAGLGSVFGGVASSALLAKVAVVGALAGGGALAGETLVEERDGGRAPDSLPGLPANVPRDAAAPGTAGPAAVPPAPADVGGGEARLRPGGRDRGARSSGRGRDGEAGRSGEPAGQRAATPGRGPAKRGRGAEKRAAPEEPGARRKAVPGGGRGQGPGRAQGRGRGPVETAPGAAPIKRGPHTYKPAPPARPAPTLRADSGPKAKPVTPPARGLSHAPQSLPPNTKVKAAKP